MSEWPTGFPWFGTFGATDNRNLAFRPVARASTPVPVEAAQTRRIGRVYETAQNTNATYTWQAPTTSADTEIRQALTRLRGRSRALDRDSPYAKRAKTIVRNNVVFTGIGMKPMVIAMRGDPRYSLNQTISDEFCYWAEDASSCHTGGELFFPDIEQQVIDQVFTAGEVFIRLHTLRMGSSPVPLALELIESEMCPHDLSPQNGFVGPRVRMGVEHDNFYRPQRYWFRESYPNDQVFDPTRASERLIPVPADQVIHVRLIERWPQVRGVPWMHNVADTLHNMRGYTQSEIVAARGASMYLAQLNRSEWQARPNSDEQEEEQQTGARHMALEPGTILTPAPGESLEFYQPNRPNSVLDPFMRFMIREIAVGIGVTYESLSRDYSQSNYSSSRLALLDDRDMWRVLQMWFIRQFRAKVHRAWMQRALYARAITGANLEEYALNPRKYEAVKWKPRGWSWIDPQKEVAAAKEAIRGGLGTRTGTIAAIGGGTDVDDLNEERDQELEDAAQLGLQFDTDPGAVPGPGENNLAATAAAASATDDATAAAAAAPDGQQAGKPAKRMRVVR